MTSDSVEFLPIEFPRTKEAVEQFIVGAFARGPVRSWIGLSAFSQNAENDFDFTVETREGSKYLELMEVAPLENLRGSYDKAPNTYRPYDFSRYILAKISKKSTRYVVSERKSLILLLYTTDWAFSLHNTGLALLQYWLSKAEHGFSEVFLYEPLNQTAGLSHWLYPTPASHWASFDAEQHREDLVYVLSPYEWKDAKG
jgi:hypothetical protein